MEIMVIKNVLKGMAGSVFGVAFVVCFWLFLIFGIIYQLPVQRPINTFLWLGSWVLDAYIFLSVYAYFKRRDFLIFKWFLFSGIAVLMGLLFFIWLPIRLEG
jgi:hypothetical protein